MLGQNEAVVSNYPRSEFLGAMPRKQLQATLNLQFYNSLLQIFSLTLVNAIALAFYFINARSLEANRLEILGMPTFFWLVFLVPAIHSLAVASKGNGWSQKEVVLRALLLVASGIPIVGFLGPLIAQNRLAKDAATLGLPMRGNRILTPEVQALIKSLSVGSKAI